MDASIWQYSERGKLMMREGKGRRIVGEVSFRGVREYVMGGGGEMVLLEQGLFIHGSARESRACGPRCR